MKNYSISFRKIAIVSGKGGSGKTMIAAMIARIFDKLGHGTLIVDSDVATGGMTYYLGLKMVKNVSVGLSTLISNKNNQNDFELPKGLIQPLKNFKGSYFIGVGDTRKLYKSNIDLSKIIKLISDKTKSELEIVIIDCRGGIDEESLSVCKAVDDIILVVESDTTSFQSSQHLVEILSDNELSQKIVGFIINKVFDDPSSIARNGTSVFKSQYLYSIPFDINATKEFLIGEIPEPTSIFGIHVWAAINKAYDFIEEPPRRPWSFKQFSEATITGNESVIGGMFMFGLILIYSSLLLYSIFISVNSNYYYMTPRTKIVIFSIIALLGALEPFRKIMGFVVKIYIRHVKKLFFGIKE